MTDQEIKEFNKKFDSEVIALCMVPKLSTYAQEVAKRPTATEAELRHAMEITRYQSLLLQYSRGRA